VWLLPYSETTFNDKNDNLFRIRFARLVFDFTPHDDVAIRLHLAAEQATAMFYDFILSWQHYDMFNVSFGQQKLMMGASVSQSGNALVMLDRPRFITKWVKKNFRDIGIVVHPKRGGDRLVDYTVGLFNSTGRIPYAENATARPVQDVTVMGRAVINPGSMLFGKKRRTALGLTAAAEPAEASADSNVAANHLGMAVVNWKSPRTTYLLGADVNVTGFAGLWLQAELMYLYSQQNDGVYRRLLGGYVEVAYTLPVLKEMLQPAARVDWSDPDMNAPSNEELVWSLGVNVKPAKWLLFSGFFTRDYQNTATGTRVGNRVETRVQIKY